MTVLAMLLLLADLRTDIQAKSGFVAFRIPTTGENHVCWGSGLDSEPYAVFEVENGRIIDLRLSSPGCDEFRNVMLLQPAGKESVALLRELVDGERRIGKRAINALGMHRDFPDEDLINIARRHASADVRSQAIFWVGQRAGRKSAAALRDSVDNDPDAEVRTKAVFAISQLPDDQSIPLLIELMRTHKNREVRKKSAFWLGQKQDPRALQALEDVLMH